MFLSIRTISNIYNFKLYRIVYKLKAKYNIYVHNRKLFTIVNNVKVRKGKSIITKKKTIKDLGLIITIIIVYYKSQTTSL